MQLETKVLSLVQIFGSVVKFGVGLDDRHYINALSLYIHVAQVFLSGSRSWRTLKMTSATSGLTSRMWTLSRSIMIRNHQIARL